MVLILEQVFGSKISKVSGTSSLKDVNLILAQVSQFHFWQSQTNDLKRLPLQLQSTALRYDLS